MPGFILTRRAARDLRDIHKRSVVNWGKARADRYLDDIYAVLTKVSVNPNLGRARWRRSAPFMMVAAGHHFVIYDELGDTVIILAILHQVRDIERIIATMRPEFISELEVLRGRRADDDNGT